MSALLDSRGPVMPQIFNSSVNTLVSVELSRLQILLKNPTDDHEDLVYFSHSSKPHRGLVIIAILFYPELLKIIRSSGISYFLNSFDGLGSSL